MPRLPKQQHDVAPLAAPDPNATPELLHGAKSDVNVRKKGRRGRTEETSLKPLAWCIKMPMLLINLYILNSLYIIYLSKSVMLKDISIILFVKNNYISFSIPLHILINYLLIYIYYSKN